MFNYNQILNEVLLAWGDNENSQTDSNIVKVDAEAIKWKFKFVITKKGFNSGGCPYTNKEVCWRNVDDRSILNVWMLRKDAEKLWKIIYGRLNQLLGSQNKVEEAFVLLRDELGREDSFDEDNPEPETNYPFGEVDNYYKLEKFGNLAINAEDWYTFVWYMIIKDIPIRIYEDDFSPGRILYEGTLEELEIQEDLGELKNHKIWEIERYPCYMIGRFIQSIPSKSEWYRLEAFPCMLANEYIDCHVPLFFGGENYFDFQTDPEVINIFKKIREKLNII